MIISRTPFRISFLGGGTDYPQWYLHNGGQVLSASIDKHCYLTLRYLPPFFEHRYRVVYSRVETVKSIDDLQHPIVRETLRHLSVTRGLEIHHDGDLPARSGIGSSSSFAVGLLNALNALSGRSSHKEHLASKATYIEQTLVGDTVGSQDQIAAAYGGLNHIVFHKQSGQVEVRPMSLKKERIEAFNSRFMLFFTGIVRTASDLAEACVRGFNSNIARLERIGGMVDEGVRILNGRSALDPFGELLDAAWQEKRQLAPEISNPVIDEIYARARKAGALGGKLTGAGGGGFLLFFVPPSLQSRVREALDELLLVPFRFDFNGSQIIFSDPGANHFEHKEGNAKNQNLS